MDPHREANLANWNDRVPIHAASATYDLSRYDDPGHLSGVVRFDRRYLDVAGRRLVHLQCHLGTDTVSWARLGAEVTGYDFSAPALEQARALAARAGVTVRFVEGELYDAPQRLEPEGFDVVYTGVGALNWLPDVRGWARVVAALLAPGGVLYLREGHPVLWSMSDPREDRLLVVAYPYFETPTPATFDEPATYTDQAGDAAIAHTTTHEWNHGLGEIVTAVLDAGLQLELLEEHRTLEWPFFPWMEPAGDGRYRLPAEQADLLPLMYSLRARKPG